MSMIFVQDWLFFFETNHHYRMAHIVRSPHDEQFYKVLQELKNETEVLIASGYTGEGFHSNGKTLGSQSVPRYKSKQVSAAAAEKRLQTSRIMLPTGGIKLGGSSSNSSLLRNDMTPAQLAAEAAEKRLKDQVWCGGSITQSPSRSSSVQQKRKNDSNTPKAQTKRSCVTIDLTEESNWACATCTFINKLVESVCQVCLSLREKNNSSKDEIISLDDDDDDNGWNCSQCTLKNSKTNNVCDACAFKRFI